MTHPGLTGRRHATRSVATVGFALALGLTLMGCGPTAASPPPDAAMPASEDGQPLTLAEIDGEPVLESDFDAYLEFLGEEADGESRESLFGRFLRQRVLERAAKGQGVDVTDAEVEGLLSETGDEESPHNPGLVDQVRRFLQVQKFIQLNIDAASEIQINEMQEYYERHAEEFVVDDQLRVLEILVDDKDLAERLRAGLKAGDFRTFRETARRHSQGATAQQGGALGPFQRGDLPHKFEDFIFALRVGEVSPTFRSELGYHIFTVEELTPRHAQKFYEVQPRIFAHLVAERERAKLEAFMQKQLDSASVRILDDRFRDSWRQPDVHSPR